MGFELLRFEILVEPKQYFRNGDRVNSMLIIELVGHLKCRHILMTAIGEIRARFYRQDQSMEISHFMSIPINLRDLVAKQEFNVKTHSNVCPSRIDSRPVAAVREKLVRLFGIKIGAVRLSAHLDRNAYFCGEVISIYFHMDNRSSKSIRFLPQLVRRTAFKKEYIFLESEELVATNDTEKCAPNGSQSDIVCIPVPADSLPTIDSPFIDITYTISLFVLISDSSEHFDEILVFIK
ncbi:unnamed protein product [Medioppia subpectinata]|uniref:Arrestin C-terminal-like domain-containing protein n=1 Tax=Medioppia subpectinata TaxID=1979941 RepID=A0A7R9KIF6_9ACAR|nr:unnamed protein product [Medioppia subpectinata]CAG2103011.1 unnamed protein product [Medioppia subpectinata]